MAFQTLGLTPAHLPDIKADLSLFSKDNLYAGYFTAGWQA
jgi:hypothetical protein